MTQFELGCTILRSFVGAHRQSFLAFPRRLLRMTGAHRSDVILRERSAIRSIPAAGARDRRISKCADLGGPDLGPRILRSFVGARRRSQESESAAPPQDDRVASRHRYDRGRCAVLRADFLATLFPDDATRLEAAFLRAFTFVFLLAACFSE